MSLVVDTQHHWFGPRYRAAIAAEAAANSAFAVPNSLFLQIDEDHPSARLDDRVDVLNEAGIDVAVLSVAPPAAAFRDVSSAAATVAIANDELVEACTLAPDRFVALALLPLPHIDESLAELKRLRQETVVRGVLVGVDALDFAPDKLAVDSILEWLAAESLPLIVHPAGHVPGPNHAFDDFALAPSFETMLWTSLVGLRFVLSGALDRHPLLDVVVPHLGGVVPYLTQRLLDQTVGRQEHDLTHYLRERLYFDNCSFHQPALRCAVETVGADRIMLGSDFPFRGDLRRCVDDVMSASFLDGNGREAMLGGTAARWFRP